MSSKKTVSAATFAKRKAELRQALTSALSEELALCAHPDLNQDPNSGDLWSTLPTVDSKTAHKISVSVIEQILGCSFDPAWIQRGGYMTVEEAVNHVIDRLQNNCVVPAAVPV